MGFSITSLVNGGVKAAQAKSAPNTVVKQNIPQASSGAPFTPVPAGWRPYAPGYTPPSSSPQVTSQSQNTSGGQQSAPAPDPYAQWGGQDNYNRLVDDFNNGKTTAFNSIGDRENSAADQYHSSILDFVDAKKQGQSGIDNEKVNNELSKLQGANSILDMVSHGVRSSAVRLAQGNAGSSSAAEQLAKAWGENGQRQMADVNNQYELGNNNINNEQQNFDSTNSTNLRHINESKSTVVNSIIDDATQKLSDLNTRAAYASIPDRVDIENEKARIRDEAMGKLQSYDAALSSGDQSVQAMSHDAAQGKAFGLNQAGKAAPNPFNLDTVLPVNTMAASSMSPAATGTLPLYIAPSNKKDSQA